MKKCLFAVLAAFVMSLAFVACGGSPASKLEDLKKKLENPKELKAQDLYDITKAGLEASIEFIKSNPSKEEGEEFNKKMDELTEAMNKAEKEVDPKVKEEYEKLMQGEEITKLKEEFEKAVLEAAKKEMEKK